MQEKVAVKTPRDKKRGASAGVGYENSERECSKNAKVLRECLP
jgi:hypothetical protein|tara:strand:+ start:70 stop:198 length:129 start_codon:yes stop_codon:yes gene_type:complete